jgi:hypothetical protein
MTQQTAFKLHVDVREDRTIKLPADVPVGPAEVIVLVDAVPAPRATKSLLGLFANEPEVVDEAMGHVLALRRNWRVRPAM